MRVGYNAQERFLGKLADVSDPETKRKIIGEEFIRVFEEEYKMLYTELGGIDFLLQGTIYPDVVESGTGESAIITWENVLIDRLSSGQTANCFLSDS